MRKQSTHIVSRPCGSAYNNIMYTQKGTMQRNNTAEDEENRLRDPPRLTFATSRRSSGRHGSVTRVIEA